MTYDDSDLRAQPRGIPDDPDHPDGGRRQHHPHDGEQHSRRRWHHPDGPGPRGRGRRRLDAGPFTPGDEHDRGRRGHGRGRAQRGDVRAAVLLLLADEPLHGYRLMHAITERTNGAWRPSPGAIYPTIALLEDEGLVSVTADGGRKLVSLTDAGREYLAENADTIADPFSAITEAAGGKNNLHDSVKQVHVAARAVADSGTDEQIAAAQALLGQTRRSLYLLLAGEDQRGDADPAQT